MSQMMLQIDHNELHLFIKVQEDLTYKNTALAIDCWFTDLQDNWKKILLSDGDVNMQYRPIAMVSCLN